MKVSIVTVCLNSVKTIEQTIQSVLNQTYKDIEYIVIDGGSRDGTCEIIEKYRSGIAYYVSELDEGLYHAMNKGIKRATGNIIGILNSDDWYDLYAIENIVKAFQECDCDLIHGKLAMVYENNQYRIVGQRNLENLYIGMTITHPTVFIKREIYNRYGVFDLKYKNASDYELMLRLYTLGIRIRFIPSVLTYFRLGGLSQKQEIINIQESYKISRYYIEKNKELDKNIWLNRLEEVYADKLLRYRLKRTIANLDNVSREAIISLLGNHLAIFGTGNYGIVCYDLLKSLAVNFDVWIDSDIKKQGKILLDRYVVSLDDAIHSADVIVIASKDYESQMREQILALHIDSIKCLSLSELEKVILSYESRSINDTKY